jgi:hypothetical protein
MGAGTKRNKPCWCNSGLKYKDCHLDRTTKPPVTMQEKLQDVHTSYNKRYCIHPNAGVDCDGDIIKAHTIQRSGGLTTIAREGHVYTLNPGVTKLIKTGSPAATLIGVHNASTFTGFCNFHDTATFRPIETNPFQSTQEHTFLLAYRALCRELFLKRARVEHLSKARRNDRGADMVKQVWWQTFINTQERAERSSLKYLEQEKALYDRCLTNADYSPVYFYVVRIDCTPDFMCSGGIMPDYDFHGNRLQVLTDYHQKPDFMTVSVISTDNGGAIVFSWAGSNKAGEELIKSLDSYSDNEICHAVVRLCFEYIENVFPSPDWWERLSDAQREYLVNRMASEIQLDKRRKQDCLVDDGMRLVAWPVTARETNIVLAKP